MKETLRRLRNGGIVTLFPEGTRSLDGELGPLKPGIAVLVARAGVPVVPAGIAGTFEAWPRSRLFPRPHPIRVHYGPPIFPEEIAGMDPQAVTALIRDRIGQSIARRGRGWPATWATEGLLRHQRPRIGPGSAGTNPYLEAEVEAVLEWARAVPTQRRWWSATRHSIRERHPPHWSRSLPDLCRWRCAQLTIEQRVVLIDCRTECCLVPRRITRRGGRLGLIVLVTAFIHRHKPNCRRFLR